MLKTEQGKPVERIIGKEQGECIPSPAGATAALPCEEKDKKRKRLIIVLLLLLAFMLIIAGIVRIALPDKEIRTGGWFYEQNATAIQDAVDQSVQEGYFNMTINSKVPVYGGTTAYVGIQNVEANHFDCVVTITLEDGTQVYKSGGLSPGQELRTIELSTSLSNGTYEATALFEIYDINESHTKAGQTASKITLFAQ